MRQGVMVTGAAFGLPMLAHAGRVHGEGWHWARSPDVAVAKAVSIGLCGWAVHLLRQSSRRGPRSTGAWRREPAARRRLHDARSGRWTNCCWASA